MANYLNTKTGEYPLHDGDLELLGWTVGTDLPADWVEVTPTEPPTITTGQTYQETTPAKTKTGYKMAWIVRNLTAEELSARALADVRSKVANGIVLTAEEAALLIN